jgi:hypothetical protein
MCKGPAYITQFLAVALLSFTLAAAASAQQPDPKVSRQRQKAATSQDTTKPLTVTRPRQPVACSEFGAGFVRMPGSDSCIRMGGAIDIGVGGSR